jgi:hypothetical protein
MRRFVCLQIVLLVSMVILGLASSDLPHSQKLRFAFILVDGMLLGASAVKLLCFFGIDGK